MKVAVFGTLRQGSYNNHLMSKFSFLEKKTLSGYKMYDLGGYPTIVQGEGSIVVEIYETDSPVAMWSLDRLEVPHNYCSEAILIDGEAVKIYLGIFSEESLIREKVRFLESGDWMESRYETKRNDKRKSKNKDSRPNNGKVVSR